MSAVQRPAAAGAVGGPARRPVAPTAAGAPQERGRLRLAPVPGTRASSGAYVMLLAGLLGIGLLGLLAVNTVLTQGSFATADLASRQNALSEQEQQLQQEVARLQSPQQLAAAATALGMVGTHNPVFIDTRTGRILGVPQAAPRPAPATTATAGPSAGPSAAASATSAPTTKPTAQPSSATKPTTKPTTRPTPHPTPTGTR